MYSPKSPVLFSALDSISLVALFRLFLDLWPQTSASSRVWWYFAFFSDSPGVFKFSPLRLLTRPYLVGGPFRFCNQTFSGPSVPFYPGFNRSLPTALLLLFSLPQSSSFLYSSLPEPSPLVVGCFYFRPLPVRPRFWSQNLFNTFPLFALTRSRQLYFRIQLIFLAPALFTFSHFPVFLLPHEEPNRFQGTVFFFILVLFSLSSSFSRLI